ncbi:MAG: hypothetical protein IH607_03755 [Firmicutes bacterium]|nr:hypothetical protein [Bacillota bacterium]
MQFYVLEGIFRTRLPENTSLEPVIDAHLAYLSAGFQDGSILFSGPRSDGKGGGVIAIKSNDIQAFCQNDPLVQAGIQEYRITEFDLYNCQESIRSWFV